MEMYTLCCSTVRSASATNNCVVRMCGRTTHRARSLKRLGENPAGNSKMAKIYQIVDVKQYRQESDRDLWYVLFEHERERGYTWQPTSVLGVIPNELRHKMLVMRRKWITSTELKHQLKVRLLWLLSGFCLASMACAGTERWRETLNDPLAFRAFQVTLPICWWIILGIGLSGISIWQALRLSQYPFPHAWPRSSRLVQSNSGRDRPPMPTRIQPERACRKR